MLETSNAYKTAIDNSVRRVVPFAEFNLISPDIIYGAVASSGMVRYANPPQLHNMVFDPGKKLATLEHNLWLLDGSYGVAPMTAETSEVGAVLENMTNANAVFDTATWLEMPVQNLNVLQAASVFFTGRSEDGTPVDFTFQLYSGVTKVFEQQVTGNVLSSVFFEGFTVYNVTAARVGFQTWSLPYRRGRTIEVLLGIYEQWQANDIDAVDVIQQTDFSNMSVAYGTAQLTVTNQNMRFNPRAKNSIFESIEERQGVPLFYAVELADGSLERMPVGVYFQTEGGWKTGATDLTFTFSLVSIVGLLSRRVPELPATLPTTVQGWVSLIVTTLGVNFAGYYSVSPSIASLPLTTLRENVENMDCGNLLRFTCMASGAFYHTDPQNGYLRVEPISNNTGTYIGLNSMFAFPEESANDDVADITFKLSDGTAYTVPGTRTHASKTLKVNNPFLHTQADANRAARNILSFYGGSKFTVRGRGDMSCEIGDIDVLESGFEDLVSARRYKQQLRFSNGVMLDTPSYHLQPSGQKLYTNRVERTQSGTWSAPAGVTRLKIVVVGPGANGMNGGNGTWEEDGAAGAGGRGGKVYVSDIVINPLQTFNITITSMQTTFGAYSASNGVNFPTGYGDIFSGNVYGRDGAIGVEHSPFITSGVSGVAGSGDGGGGGSGGQQGVRAWDGVQWIIRSLPVAGGYGGAGGTGAVIIYYDQN